MKAPIAAVLILALPALVAGQSLGEMARKEKERQKKAPNDAKVITNEDLATTRGQLANDPGASPAASAKPGSVPSVAPRSGESDFKQQETEWRNRVAQATARVETAKRALESANVTLIPGAIYVDQQGNRVRRPQDVIARAKAELDAAQKALDELLETARREGVPPGWLR